MDTISGMFRPALDRIRPSIASAAVFSFSRVVSFTGSFNSRTGLLSGDGEETPSSQVHETTASTSTDGGVFDIEAPATTPDQAVRDDDDGAGQEEEAGGGGDADEPKRVSKSVQTVCLFVASASLAMSVNLPAARPGAGALYGANLGFICLGLFTSLGLSMYTIVSRPGDAAVARVQKWAMVLALASVPASFTLRMCATLPGETLESAWLIFFLLAGAAALYLTLAWKLAGGGWASTGASTRTSPATLSS